MRPMGGGVGAAAAAVLAWWSWTVVMANPPAADGAPASGPSTATASQGAGAVIETITPDRGEETGGFMVTLSGRGLPFFATDPGFAVYVNRDLPCRNVTVVTPFTRLRCVMPPCVKCEDATVRIRVGAAFSNPITFRYHPTCYDPVTPLLAARYSAAENCTICTTTVAVAVSLMGDVTSHQGMREALRDACGSRLLKSFSPVRQPYCTTDLSHACTILFYSFANALADVMWAQWDEGMMAGTLPDTACAAIGRCPPMSSGG